MDQLPTENDQFGFDDNGPRNVRLPVFEQPLAFIDSISDKATEESKLSNCHANPAVRDEDEDESTEIAFDDRKFCWKEPFDDERGTSFYLVLHRTDGPNKKIEDRPHIPAFIFQIYKQDGAENFVGTSATGSGKVGVEEAKFRLGRCVSFQRTYFAAMSWQYSASFSVGILLLMASAGVEGALISVPVNTLFVVGQTARMNCSTDLNRPVYWVRTLAGSDVQQRLYHGKNGFNGNHADDRFSIDTDEATGRYDLIIADVQQKDAGQYVCIDESGLGARASAELVISDPIKCNSHIPNDGVMGDNVFGIEQDFIQVSCSLTYTGNLSPTLEWSWPGSEVQSVESEVSAATSSVTSILKLFPNKEQNNTKFQCKAKIEGSTQLHTIDSALLWESETVNVKYAEFASKEVDMCHGVKWNLICNPQCSYHLERKDNDCQCLYTYYDTRTQQKFELISDAVRCGRGVNDILLAILIVAAVVAAFAVVVIFLLVCCVKKKYTKRVEKDNEAIDKRPPSGSLPESGHDSIDDNSCKPMLEVV